MNGSIPKQAVSSIEVQLSHLQGSANKAAESIQFASSSLKETVGQVISTNEIFEDIYDCVNEVNEQNTLIATATEQQSATTAMMSEGINDMRVQALETVRSSADSGQAADELAKMSANLSNVVQQFDLK